MKQYHTSIEINASAGAVWNELTNFNAYPQWNPIVGSLKGEIKTGGKIDTYIVPLGKTYSPTLLAYSKKQELTWIGVQGVKFLMAGKHYYKLESLGTNTTRLLHGEYFTGLLSWFISKSILAKMKQAFLDHNSILKERVENGRQSAHERLASGRQQLDIEYSAVCSAASNQYSKTTDTGDTKCYDRQELF